MISKANKSILIFCVFAFGFFISNLLRSITATLTPVLTSEFDLTVENNVAYYLNHNLMKIEDDGNFYAKNRYMLTYEEVN